MTNGSGGTVDQRSSAAGANLVNFLRGQRGTEGFFANTNKLYRARTHVLGDIVNAQPVYVKPPPFDYADAGYAAFKASQANRESIVYVAANDGMLHAFGIGTAANSFTDGGNEKWAFMPSMVLPRLYKLADVNYASLHEYFLDGTPTVDDVYDSASSAWRSILVAGLGRGGKGFYALDVTDPNNPKALWEFGYSSTCYDAANPATAGADCHIGLSIGNPRITKLRNGQWVVLVTSGLNNVNSTALPGDGKGYLYVLNALTGKIIYKIATTAGDAATPSGLAKINNWVNNALVDNTTERVYAGDMLGNLWRFDINNEIDPAGREASLLATLADSAGNPQPVTTKPELGEVGAPAVPIVFVGTGRFLGTSDIANKSTQTIYGIKDKFGSTPVTRSDLGRQSISQSNGVRSMPDCSTSCADTTNGWYIDLPDSGERVNVDPKLVRGTLVVATNVPTDNQACKIGGYSYLNFFDYKTGRAVSTATLTADGKKVGQYLGDALVVGINDVKLGNKQETIVTMSDDKRKPIDTPVGGQSPTGKRISWREIVK